MAYAKDNLGLVAWAKSKLGAGYVYGTYFGKIVDLALLDAKRAQYPTQYANKLTCNGVTKTAYEWAKKWIGKEAGDCVGLIKGYYWLNPDLNKVVYKLDGRADTSANGMLNAAKSVGGRTPSQNTGVTWGAIKTIPEIPGILVHRDGHIGIYIGNGEVIESRGTCYGVVKTKLADRGFTSWCKCAYIDYISKTEEDDMVICKRGDGSSAAPNPQVVAMQKGYMAIGYVFQGSDGTIYGADGNFGGATSRVNAQFQQDNGLPVNGDVFDSDTNAKLTEKIVAQVAVVAGNEAAVRQMLSATQTQLQTERAAYASATDELKSQLNAKVSQIESFKAGFNGLMN